MRVPTIFGRKMKLVKKYEHYCLFIDEKTGIKECFQNWDLTHKYYLGEYNKLSENENKPLIKRLKSGGRPNKRIYSDNALMKIINQLEGIGDDDQ